MDPEPCDVIFVFAGTHPGHWEKSIEAYLKKVMAKKIIVTGGVSPTGIKHGAWNDPRLPEANVIGGKLLQQGIKAEDIVFENRSGNTLENVLCAKHIFDFTPVGSVLMVFKNHAAGRQYRTLAHHVLNPIRHVPFGFDAIYGDTKISRQQWMLSEIGRAMVFGEYLRIVHYARMGHLQPPEHEVEGLGHFLDLNLQMP